MSVDQSEQLLTQKITAKSVEITKSLPQYDWLLDVDKFNIQLAQFVKIAKTELKQQVSMLLLRLRG
jgi:uncharacterized protein YfaT (DUF1175 family)